MVAIKPSKRTREIKRGSHLVSLCLFGAMASGCVSQSEVLTVNNGLQQPSPQLGLTAENTTTDQELVLDANRLAPNIPSPAPRRTNSTTATGLAQNTNGSQVGSTVGTQVVAEQETSSALAAVDPNMAKLPAETVINSVSTVSTDETQNAVVPATNTVATANTSTDTTQSAAQQTEAGIAPTPSQPVIVEKPKATGLFARLFQNNNVKRERKPKTNRINRFSTGRDEEDGGTQFASLRAAAKKKTIVRESTASTRANNGALPGVKSTSQLFGVTEDETLSNTRSGNLTQVAAVGSLGLVSPNGIRIQHSKVQVACLKPEIIRMLKIVERNYGRKPIVTSGYRSPKRNRRAGGAKNSMHIYCKAADIQVEGISKWQLAKYLRTIPGRGGVGTYCRTKSVHIDTGSQRDWHHPCRRSSKRKKRKT